jgi:hypothetical protein
MSHRRPTSPRQPALEGVLRIALRLAADSIEPGADGLDRIRAKISARQSAPLPRWRTFGAIVVLLSLLRRFEPAVIWVRYAAGVVADRFRPESEHPGGLGWIGWLRPAAALATGLFVVAAASWAIAALPQLITQVNHSHHYTGGGGGGGGGPASSSKSAPFSSQNGSGSNSPAVSPSPSGSCTTSAPPSPSPSGSPSISPSPTPSTSSTTGTPTPSPTPTTSGTSGSPSPSQSAPASTGTTTGSQTAQEVMAASAPGGAVVSPAAPSSSSSPSGCGS